MSDRTIACRVLWASIVVLCASSPRAEEERQPAPPHRSDLVERTERRLVQLDVSIRGPEETIASLTADDFELVIGGREIPEFTIDRLCEERDAEQRPTAPDRLAASPAADQGPETELDPPALPAERPTTYLFYFDQTHLTMTGRHRSLELARQLIGDLVTGQTRAMIVSDGRELTTFADLTSDHDELLRALDELERDRMQWDTFATHEEDRVREIADAFGAQRTSRDPKDPPIPGEGLHYATRTALRHQREERWRTERALRRLRLVLGLFADMDPPKAVLYFADTMRSRPGEHYLNFFRAAQKEGNPALMRMEMDSFAAMSTFDSVIDEAVAHGVRLYTVQAEGLVAGAAFRNTSFNTTYAVGSHPVPYYARLRDAQDSLVGLALETGGKAFLNGLSAKKIARRIREDLSCYYLLSFEPSGLPEEKPLRVLLRVDEPGVTARTRGRVFVQSKESILTSRLMAAFVAPEAARSEAPVRGVLIPTGFRDGRFWALFQVAASGSSLAGTTWDMGLSLVSSGKVRDDASGRISVSGPGVPVVFETELAFDEGPFEVVMVAHENRSDTIATGEFDGSWPNLDEQHASVGPIAVMQPTPAAFLRGSELRRSGGLGLADDAPGRGDRPTALVGIVCRSKRKAGTLRIERTLSGETSVDFPEQDLDLSEERCAVFQDLIPAGTMSEGIFLYDVHVLHGETEIASASREFVVVAGDH